MAKQKDSSFEKTPVAILWDGILLLPITGVVDSKRSQEIMESILKKITEVEARVIILDILGVSTVDSAIATHLIKITKATKLMGTECIITGISPEIAQTFVQLGIELGEVSTRATLKDGLIIAFDVMGVEVKQVKTGQLKIKM